MKKVPSTAKLPPSDCVVRVGDGRGFIVEHDQRPMIITAAHCLPNLPPAHAMSYLKERTYAKLIGSLGGEKKIWAECLFVDPVADLALLGNPDDQELFDQAEAYSAFVGDRSAVCMSGNVTNNGWVLSLEGNWVPMLLHVVSGLFGTSLCISRTEAGQSGSPILNEAGQAVAVIVIGGSSAGIEGSQGPQPILYRDLPSRYVNTCNRKAVSRHRKS